MVSIFELERRGDINREYKKLYEDILNREEYYVRSVGQFISLRTYIELNIEECPFFTGISSINEFIEVYDINEKAQEEQILYMCDFLLNFFNWANKRSSTLEPHFDYFHQQSPKTLSVLMKQIKHILEISNYRFEYFRLPAYKFDVIKIVKRDQDVDSVLHLLGSDARLKVLEYLDFRNEKNIERKKEILSFLYIKFEEIKETLNSSEKSSTLFKDTKACLNFPRHFKEKTLDDTTIMRCLDYSFYMYIHFMRERFFADNKEILTIIKQNQ